MTLLRPSGLETSFGNPDLDVYSAQHTNYNIAYELPEPPRPSLPIQKGVICCDGEDPTRVIFAIQPTAEKTAFWCPILDLWHHVASAPSTRAS
ncbi:hypothetical protein CRENBAI_005229 [Crenichthys baileyi]|uniref:Uncharacterized protein n=1 Tax=Crenichthys baileyi TaxID=28760 RepID=A0AAV9S6A5_9TELE